MSSGIYAYWDNVKNYYVYVGKDSHIDKKERHKDHIKKCNYNKQPINRIVQNNPERYEYRIIMEGNYNEWELNKMEKLCIKSFKTFKHDYPERSVFNFTKGGDGSLGYRHPEETRKKMSENSVWKNKTFSREHREKMSESRKGEKNHNYGKKLPEETKKKISENHADVSGKNNPRAKYTIWNISTTHYNKNNMLKNNPSGKRPKNAFTLKYNGKRIYIGTFIDFTTPEIIHDLICEAIDN